MDRESVGSLYIIKILNTSKQWQKMVKRKSLLVFLFILELSFCIIKPRKKHMKEFSELQIKNCRCPKYSCELYWSGEIDNKGQIILDTIPFPGNINLLKIFRSRYEDCRKMLLYLEKAQENSNIIL